MRLFKVAHPELFAVKDSILLGLAVMSLGILLMPSSWLAYKTELPLNEYTARILAYPSDSTVATWIGPSSYSWRCRGDVAIKTAFCSLLISIHQANGEGLDLSAYTTVRIKGSYQGKGKTIRVYLRNSRSDYYVPGDEMSTKYNLIEIPVGWLESGRAIPMTDFVVAEWWLKNRGLSPEFTQTNFDNIVFIEIQTGSFFSGEEQLKIESITLDGAYFTREHLYRVVGVIWLVVIALLFVFRIFMIAKDLRSNAIIWRKLNALNAALSLKNKELESQAKRDMLTGALNRFGVRDAFLDMVHGWKKNNNYSSALIMIDLDYFKKINDTHGHDAGDKVLCATTNLIQESLPGSCYLARWGGEEFVIVALGMNGVDAKHFAESLRVEIAKHQIEPNIQVSASFGVAEYCGGGVAECLKKADTALYNAKVGGRNRVEYHDGDSIALDNVL